MISVVIVSYQVRFFLEQCLAALQQQAQGVITEIIVIDNHSADDSFAYLQPRFPHVRWVINHINEGFARACNKGLKESRGELVLFLNPDTLVAEDTLAACVRYLSENPVVGALGVPMLDGRGRFLPESKRSFPTPMASFYKLSGLAFLFPGSARFNRYALGDLPSNTTQTVDVLAGAFMLCRRKALEDTGGFDERFFLYGEDIDLSYRIQQAGWQNHYFAGTRIIHFKGESVGSNQGGHVRHFYKAMSLFVTKHYQHAWPAASLLLIRIAIFGRAALSLLARAARPVILPLADVLLLFLSFDLTRMAWIQFQRGGTDFHVPFVSYAPPVMSLLFIGVASLAGLYGRYASPAKTARSLLWGIVCVLALYALLPESLRFSRGVVVCGAVFGAALIWILHRAFAPLLRWLGYQPDMPQVRIAAGAAVAFQETEQLLFAAGRADKLYHASATVTATELLRLARQSGSRDIIFCIGALKINTAIDLMCALKGKGLRFHFHMEGSGSIVGSEWPTVSGQALSSCRPYRIATPLQRKMKRVTDVILALLLLLSFPFHLIFHAQPLQLVRNAWKVLTARVTWVGYSAPAAHLPPLKPGIVAYRSRAVAASKMTPDEQYALHYDWWQDIFSVFRQYRKLA